MSGHFKWPSIKLAIVRQIVQINSCGFFCDGISGVVIFWPLEHHQAYSPVCSSVVAALQEAHIPSSSSLLLKSWPIAFQELLSATATVSSHLPVWWVIAQPCYNCGATFVQPHTDDIQLELLLCNLTIKRKGQFAANSKKVFWARNNYFFDCPSQLPMNETIKR